VDEIRSSRSLAASVAALGIAQIISWGSLFYTIAVLGPALATAAGVGEIALFASFSAGLVVSGLLAPMVGQRIDTHGGRSVLSGGSVLAAIACAALALVQGPVSMLVAWLLAGVAMAATLYDPAFATLNDIAGPHYRRAVTALTLFGGLASTVFWPLSHLLLERVGLRETFAIYAVVHVVVCLPLHWWCVPARSPRVAVAGANRTAAGPALHAQRAFLWLATALALVSLVASGISAHLIGLLTASGIGLGDAVFIGAMFGPMQVAGRVMEFTFARRIGPIAAGYLAFAAMAVSLVVLAVQNGVYALALLFVLGYGWSNGVLTIVRGTVPAELFGREGYGALLGRLALPQVISRALAPAAVAGILVVDPSRFATLATFVVCGVLACVAYRRAIVAARRGKEVEVSR